MSTSENAPVVRLDGALMTDKEQAHDYIARAFGFPEWYGRNLDALWDMLTTREETTVFFKNAQMIPLNMGEYGTALLSTIQEAAEENPRLHIHFGQY